jgi:hypothetical protein
MMKKLLLVLLFIPLLESNAQLIFDENAKFYNSYDNPTSKKYVGASWLPGTIILADGRELVGQVRGYSYKGNDINSFRFRPAKGEKAATYKAEDCKIVIYDGLRILALPKKLKKMSGKNRFYIALFHGKHLTVLQDPTANAASSGTNEIILNEGQLLNYLAIKNNAVFKLTKLNFRKQIRKLCSNNKKWVEKSQEKKWLNYNNMYDVALYYNQTID